MTVEGYPIVEDDYRHWRGDSLELILALETASGVPVSLSGFGTAWSAQLRTDVSAGGFVAFTVDASHVADVDDPRLILTLTGAQTAAMTAQSYGYDVQATGGGQSPFTVWTGRIVMDGEYTRG